MLKLQITALNAIQQGIVPKYKVRVHFKVPQDYSEDDSLVSVGQMRWSMSKDGMYEITNGSITLKNINYYFSRFFDRELPDNKRVEVFLLVGATEVLLTSVVVRKWKLTPFVLTLDVNA